MFFVSESRVLCNRKKETRIVNADIVCYKVVRVGDGQIVNLIVPHWLDVYDFVPVNVAGRQVG